MPVIPIDQIVGNSQNNQSSNNIIPIDNIIGNQQNSNNSESNVTNDLNQASSALDGLGTTSQSQPQQPSSQGSLMDGIMNNIAQFGKSEASVLPFAGRLAQLGGLISGQNMSPDQMNDLYSKVPPPQGVMQNISSIAGQIAPQLLTMAPFMKGAGLLAAGAQDAIKGAIPNVAGKIAGGIAGSPMVKGALGLGAYQGTKTALQGGDMSQVSDATTQGMQQGLIYGALTKLGASIIPKNIPMAQTAGSAVGGAIAGALTGSGGNNSTASAMLMGGLSALMPEERMDFHKMVANNVTQPQLAKYLREGLQIPAEDTKTILDNGMQEIERVGTMKEQVPNAQGSNDTLGPVQIAQKFYNKGIDVVNQGEDGHGGLNKKFADALDANNNIKPADIQKFTESLKSQVDSYADPTSPTVRRFNTMFNVLQNVSSPDEDEVLDEKGNVIPGKVTISGGKGTMSFSKFPPEVQAKMRQQLAAQEAQQAQRTGQPVRSNQLGGEWKLNQLHTLKTKLYDGISDSAWKTKQFDPNERFAYVLGKKISNFIGENNPLYKQAALEYSKMKDVKADINTLSTTNLGKDWSRLDPANKIDMMNKLNGISSYFKQNGVNKYDPIGLLHKYHAYNSINNPDPTSFRSNAPMKIAFERGATLMGAALGLPFGLHTSAIGGSIGYMTAINYMRPSSYIPILKEMAPNLKVPDNMSSKDALATLKGLIAKESAGKPQAVQLNQ